MTFCGHTTQKSRRLYNINFSRFLYIFYNITLFCFLFKNFIPTFYDIRTVQFKKCIQVTEFFEQINRGQKKIILISQHNKGALF